MGFASYDVSRFPVVQVTFHPCVPSTTEFQNFLNQWLQLYTRKEMFTLVFHTHQMKMLPVHLCFKMSRFIKKLKRQPQQFLKRSVIIVNSKFTRGLLNIIFALQKPVAPVFITRNTGHVSYLITEEFFTAIPDDVSVILPRNYLSPCPAVR